MRRAYKFRMRPTARQHIALAACVDAHRVMYNAALQERRDAWRASRTRISYGDQSAQLREIRALRPDLAVWSFFSQQATLRRLNRAFQGFFQRVKAAARPGHPRFKAKARFDTVEWPKDGDGAAGAPTPAGCICKVWAVKAARSGSMSGSPVSPPPPTAITSQPALGAQPPPGCPRTAAAGPRQAGAEQPAPPT